MFPEEYFRFPSVRIINIHLTLFKIKQGIETFCPVSDISPSLIPTCVPTPFTHMSKSLFCSLLLEFSDTRCTTWIENALHQFVNEGNQIASYHLDLMSAADSWKILYGFPELIPNIQHLYFVNFLEIRKWSQWTLNFKWT